MGSTTYPQYYTKFDDIMDKFKIWDNKILTQDEIDTMDLLLVPEPAKICLLGLGELVLLRRKS